MRALLDGVVFTPQHQGSISVLFRELLKRLVCTDAVPTQIALAGLLVFMAWAAALYKLLGSQLYWRTAGRPLVVPVLFFTAIDSDIVSIGNVLHVPFLALATAGLFARRKHRHGSASTRTPITLLPHPEPT